MAKSAERELQLPAHGSSILPRVTVDSFNVEIKDDGEFVGDQASKGAFWEILEKWRKLSKKEERDPFGRKTSQSIGKQKLAKLLADGDARAAAVVASSVEDYASALHKVIRRYLRLKEWQKTESIVIGGGFSASRLGQLAAARAELLLRAEGINIDLRMIGNKPDEAGLIGSVHLVPTWMLKGHGGMLALDLGGTNFRAGIVTFGKRSLELAEARVVKVERWRHAERKISRDAAIKHLVRMMKRQITWARVHDIHLVPLIGVACPGIVEEDGSIKRGGQNLPGNWESKNFNLPSVLRKKIPKIGKEETLVVMHNDAVVQGLSELPRYRDRQSWAALTIGTGLGNARYTTRKANGG